MQFKICKNLINFKISLNQIVFIDPFLKKLQKTTEKTLGHIIRENRLCGNLINILEQV